MTEKTVYTWQQFGNAADKGANGLPSYAGTIETQATHGRVKLHVESFQGQRSPEWVSRLPAVGTGERC